MTQNLVTLEGVSKAFTLHLRDGMKISVVDNVSFGVKPGECVVLGGPSGAGKSSILKMIYGNYRCDHGRILVRDGEEDIDVATDLGGGGQRPGGLVRQGLVIVFGQKQNCHVVELLYFRTRGRQPL